jgi:hypothetical protein
VERTSRLSENSQRIRSFRSSFSEFEQILPVLRKTLPELLTKLYSDCQAFAEKEIRSLLKGLEQTSGIDAPTDLKADTGTRVHK